MKTKIHRDNIPFSLPIGPTLLSWLFFDRIKISSFGWGIYWSAVVLLWILILHDIYTSKYKEVLFKEKEFLFK